MSDLIDRQAVIKIINDHIFYNDYDSMDKIDLVNAIENLPSAERCGWWIYDENGMDWNLAAWVCSECHCRNDNIPTVIKFGNEYKRITDPLMWQGSRFCPNCGVRMRD